MPFDMLDVNVTPSKTDVRFADSRSVFSSVYRAVQNALSSNRKIFSSNNNEAYEIIKNEIAADEIAQNCSKNMPNLEQNSNNNYKLDQKQEVKPDLSQIITKLAEKENTEEKEPEKQNSQPKSNDLLEKFSQIKSDKKFEFPNNSSIFKAGESTSTINFNKKPPIVKSNLFDEIDEEFSVTHQIIGQIFNCYLIVAKGNEVYLIDQHAAHERLIYDKFIMQIEEKNIATQPLLTPQVIEVSAKDSTLIENLLEDIRKIGFDIEEFGNFTFKINSIPIIFPTFDGSKFINELLQERNSLKNIDLKDVLHSEIAKKACKSAIKAGQKLKDMEIRDLIEKIEQNKPIQCPHGRPTIIKFTKKDIDKLFKRIL